MFTWVINHEGDSDVAAWACYADPVQVVLDIVERY
jgi:hypothetical protein